MRKNLFFLPTDCFTISIKCQSTQPLLLLFSQHGGKVPTRQSPSGGELFFKLSSIGQAILGFQVSDFDYPAGTASAAARQVSAVKRRLLIEQQPKMPNKCQRPPQQIDRQRLGLNDQSAAQTKLPQPLQLLLHLVVGCCINNFPIGFVYVAVVQQQAT